MTNDVPRIGISDRVRQQLESLLREGREPITMEVTGRVRQPKLGISSFIRMPRIHFTNHRMGVGGERIQMLEALPDDQGRVYSLTQSHPEEPLLEMIAAVLTNPARIEKYFELLKELGIDSMNHHGEYAYECVRAALINRL